MSQEAPGCGIAPVHQLREVWSLGRWNSQDGSHLPVLHEPSAQEAPISGSLPACLVSQVSQWVLGVLLFQVPPLGPSHPGKKKEEERIGAGHVHTCVDATSGSENTPLRRLQRFLEGCLGD